MVKLSKWPTQNPKRQAIVTLDYAEARLFERDKSSGVLERFPEIGLFSELKAGIFRRSAARAGSACVKKPIE